MGRGLDQKNQASRQFGRKSQGLECCPSNGKLLYNKRNAERLVDRYLALRVQRVKKELTKVLSEEKSGGKDEEGTPVPIPNTAVKLLDADDSGMETSRENMTLPDIYSSIAQSVD